MGRSIDNLIEALEIMFADLHPLRLKDHPVNRAECQFRIFITDYRNPEIWVSQNGVLNSITQMSDEHLANTVAMLDRQIEDPKTEFQPYEIERYGNLRKEWFRRKLANR